MDGRTDGRTEGWMDGWMDGFHRLHRSMHVHPFARRCFLAEHFQTSRTLRETDMSLLPRKTREL